MSFERITSDRLNEIAAKCSMSIPAGEAAAYLKLTNFVSDVIDSLDSLPIPLVGNLGARRNILPRPSSLEDPLNAIACRCDVGGGYAGLLEGRNIVIKDAIAVAGIPLTCGSHLLDGYVPDQDSTVTDRLLRAGGRIVATTNMDGLGMSGGGESCALGPVRNPHDLLRSAGGSSGGSAAALHYQQVDGALGADQGGSIRVPSAWCGVIGLKPTHGLVPYTGIVSLDRSVDHAGPMARSTEMIARLLQTIAGRDGIDERQIGVPEVIPDYLGTVAEAPQNLSGIRVGIVKETLDPASGIDNDTAQAMNRVVEKLRSLGATVEPISLPAHMQAGGIVFATILCGMAEALGYGGNGYPVDGIYSPRLAEAVAEGLSKRADRLSHQIRVGILHGTHLHLRHHGQVYVRARQLHSWLRAAYDTALLGQDLLLMPTVPHLPFALDDELELADRVLRGWGVLGNTMVSDVTGHPAITLPIEQSGHLPVGAMFVAKRFAEPRLLSVARTIESACGWAPLNTPLNHRGPFD